VKSRLLSALGAAVICIAHLAASSSSQATTLLSEGFDDISLLQAQGWSIKNESVPLGSVPEGWFQGGDFVFAAHSGSLPNSFIASNFNAADTSGQLSNWLITPTFSTVTAGTVTFWIRGDDAPGFQDQVAFGFSDGSDATADFAMFGSQVVEVGAWNKITVPFSAGAPGSIGRFAIEHVGLQDFANYVGVDTLSIDTEPQAVPLGPSTWPMMLLGLAGIGFMAFRRRSKPALMAV
jgi:hypothetical protein